MAYDYPRLFGKIIEVASGDAGITERMHALISECEAQNPHSHWARFHKIDYEADTHRLRNWLHNAFQESQLPTHPQGLWFGLINVQHRENVVAEAYVGASGSYEGGSIEWARRIEPLQENNYLGSTVLRNIYLEAYGPSDGLGNEAEYPLTLAFGAIAARVALAERLPATLRSLRGAAVGFDGGDLLFLGEFEHEEFVSNVRAG